jgi:hypothetical protein
MSFENGDNYAQIKQHRERKEKYAGIALCIIVVFIFNFYDNNSYRLLFTQVSNALGATFAVVLMSTLFTSITQYVFKLYSIGIKTHYVFAFCTVVFILLAYAGKDA